MSELVSAITSSEIGRAELEKIFEEAESYGEDKGYMLRNLWDEECSMFSKDQVRWWAAAWSASPPLQLIDVHNLICASFFHNYNNSRDRKKG